MSGGVPCLRCAAYRCVCDKTASPAGYYRCLSASCGFVSELPTIKGNGVPACSSCSHAVEYITAGRIRRVLTPDAASPVLEPAQDAQDGGYERCRYLTCIRPMNHSGEHHLGYEPVPEAGSVTKWVADKDIRGMMRNASATDGYSYTYVALHDFNTLLARCEVAERQVTLINAFVRDRDSAVDAEKKALADRDRLATRVGEARALLERERPFANVEGRKTWVADADSWLSHKDPAT